MQAAADPENSRASAAAPLTVVALGASAGGLEALRTFFAAVEPHPAIAYVVITHLAASHASHLDELLGRVAKLPVTLAQDGEPVQTGHVYLNVPGRLLGISKGRLTLEANPERPPTLMPGTVPMPIDHFMTALAEDLGDASVGIVLSGTAHDGTAGIKAIRAAGGLTLVQAPETAEFPGMPNSAIVSGRADQVLMPRDMPAALLDYLNHVPLDLAPAGPAPDTAPQAGADAQGPEAQSADSSLLAVLRLLQVRTGHDFGDYRPAMLRRRLRRRMALCRLVHVADYIGLLENSKDEVESLKNEFLIGVTDFFRDPPAWAELTQSVIPALVVERLQDDAPIRVWTPGCATGEESYSIAMLLFEQTEGKIDPQRIQIFGTDIDLRALALARAGAYPAGTTTSLSAYRLARFFDLRGENFVVRKTLRDAILFTPQDLVRDTPFSKLDLVICRNLLIYFKPELQQRVFKLFHFALKPNGVLMLGKAESVSSQTELFTPASLAHPLYRRIGTRSHLPRGFGSFDKATVPGQQGTQRAPLPLGAVEIVQTQLAGRIVSAAVLVDRDNRTLYFEGDTAPFFQLQGNASLELSTLVQPELRVRVRSVLRVALGEGKAASSDINHRVGKHVCRLHLEAEPVKTPDALGLALLMFTLPADPVADAADPSSAMSSAPADSSHPPDPAHHELAKALEDAERSNEDLLTANEESLALNEELQSANEELESSKEELESLNEELSSVNSQLDEKLSELALKNDDLNNLLVNTGLATILLDVNGRIRQFTPLAGTVFNLQAGDEGRHLSDISSLVSDPNFEANLAQVALSTTPSTAEVRLKTGHILLRRILPYRTKAGAVDGAVVTYTDVTALRDAAQRTRELFAVFQDSNDAILIYDRDGKILAWNDGAQKIYGHTREAVLGTSLYSLLPPAAREPTRELLERVLATGQGATQDAPRIRQDGTPLVVSITVSALRDAYGTTDALISTERDISHQLRAESEIYFRRLADRIPVLLRVEDALGSAQFVNQPCCVFTGRPLADLLGDGWLQFVHPEDRSRYLEEHAAALAERGRLETDLRMRRADGVYRWMRSVTVPHFEADDEFVGYIGLMLDMEDRKVAESALRDADRRKDDFLAMLAHELRNPLAPIRTAVALITRSAVPNTTTTWAVDVIGRQTDLLAKLLDDLLDVARIARGKVSLDKSPLELAVLVQRSVEVCQPLIDVRHHRLTVDVPADPLIVEGDLVRLTQVVSNLLTNAAKYTDEGGQIHLEVRRDGESALILVRDTGMGMQPELLALIFDPFMQADETLERSRGGLGLGLTLVKQLVELHGGTVEAHSAGLGQGSEFIVRLPLQPQGVSVAPPAVSDPSHEQTAVGPPVPTACKNRVLIVDDNLDAAQMLALLMRSAGHEASVAFEGHEALAIAEREHPQVIVLDIGLPGLDGYEVARGLRAAQGTAHARLIALTGYGQPDDVARAYAAGFDHHFVKPVDPQVILDLADCATE